MSYDNRNSGLNAAIRDRAPHLRDAGRDAVRANLNAAQERADLAAAIVAEQARLAREGNDTINAALRGRVRRVSDQTMNRLFREAAGLKEE